MIDKDSAHHLSRDTEELRPILPGNTTLVDQTQIRFVDQRGWRERVIQTLVAQIQRCAPAQFCVDDHHQIVARAKVATRPRSKQAGDQAGLFTPHRGALRSPAHFRVAVWRFHDAAQSVFSRYLLARSRYTEFRARFYDKTQDIAKPVFSSKSVPAAKLRDHRVFVG